METMKFLPILMLELIIGYSTAATNQESALPKFLMDAYDCWKSYDANASPAGTCLPETSEYNLHNSNSVKMIKGRGFITTSEGFYSNKLKVSILPPSHSIAFSSRDIPTENIRYGFITIDKMALSNDIANRITEQCNEPLSLQLLWKVFQNDHIYTPLSSVTLTPTEIAQSMDMEFKGVTTQLREWQQRNSDMDVRLIIGENNSCYNSFTLEDFGFSPHNPANVVLFTMRLSSNREPLLGNLNTRTDSRMKRNIGNRPNELHANISGNSTNYTEIDTCKLHSFTVTFADLEPFRSEAFSIIYPTSYQANYCAGFCDFPPAIYSSKRHQMQMLASQVYHDLSSPTTCCSPSQLQPFTFIASIVNTTEYFLVQWPNFIATSCACN